MPKKKSLNPLAVGLGVALGAVGAVVLSKKENRTKVKKAVKSMQKDTSKQIMSYVGQMMTDLGILSEQKDLDAQTKAPTRKRKK